MKHMPLLLILLLGCRAESPYSAQEDSQTNTSTENATEETKDCTVNEDSTCEDCEYRRYELELIAEYGDKYDAYVDIRIPKGKLATCELEEMRLCFKEKTLPIVYQFIPETLRGAGRATKWDDESKSSVPNNGKDGEPMFRFTHNALYKKDTKFWSWETNVYCSQIHGIISISAHGKSPDAGLGIFLFRGKHSDDNSYRQGIVGKELEFNRDDTCFNE